MISLSNLTSGNKVIAGSLSKCGQPLDVFLSPTYGRASEKRA